MKAVINEDTTLLNLLFETEQSLILRLCALCFMLGIAMHVSFHTTVNTCVHSVDEKK